MRYVLDSAATTRFSWNSIAERPTTPAEDTVATLTASPVIVAAKTKNTSFRAGSCCNHTVPLVPAV